MDELKTAKDLIMSQSQKSLPKLINNDLPPTQEEVVKPPKPPKPKRPLIVVTRVQKTRDDITEENKMARLAVQNESLRNHLRQLSIEMDQRIAEKKNKQRFLPYSEHKPSVDYDRLMGDKVSKSKKYENSLKRHSQTLSAKLQHLEQNPTYQTELIQKHSDLDL